MYIIDYFHTAGGTEVHLANLAKLLDKKRFNCFIVGFDIGDVPLIRQLKDYGIKVIHLPVGRYYTLNALKKASELLKIIKENNITLVQTFHFKSDTYGALIARLAGVKRLISSKRDTGDLKSGWHYFLNSRMNRFFDGFIVVADAVGRVASQKEKIPQDKMTIIYNGVDTKRFAPPTLVEKVQLRQKLGISASDFVIGTVAWFRPEKGYDIFFKAIESATKSIQDIKAVVVGGGHLLGYYKDYAKKMGFENKVIFTGPTGDVVEYLKVMDVACLVPTSNEGFSNSILEKMATGLPLIVSNVGGNEEAVINGYNGIVIPLNNSAVITDAISKLYHNTEKRKEMGLMSRERTERYFSIEKMVHLHEEYYEKIMS